MATFAELRLSGEGIPCQAAFDQLPSIECELDPVDTGNREMCLVGAERSAIENALAMDPTIGSHDMVATEDGRWRYEIEFMDGFEELFALVDDLSGAVLSAVGTGGAWMVRFGLSRREDVRDIYDQLMEYDLDIEVVRLADSTVDDSPSTETTRQWEPLGVEPTNAVSNPSARSP